MAGDLAVGVRGAYTESTEDCVVTAYLACGTVSDSPARTDGSGESVAGGSSHGQTLEDGSGFASPPLLYVFRVGSPTKMHIPKNAARCAVG